MKITILEKDYTLKYRNKEILKIDETLDKPILEMYQDGGKDFSKMTTIFGIVYCGIQEEIEYDYFVEHVKSADLLALLPSIQLEIANAFDGGSKVEKKKTILQRFLNGIGIKYKA